MLGIIAASETMAKPKRAVRAVFTSMLTVDIEALLQKIDFGRDFRKDITRLLERTGGEVKS